MIDYCIIAGRESWGEIKEISGNLLVARGSNIQVIIKYLVGMVKIFVSRWGSENLVESQRPD